MDISDDLLCLYSATIDQQDGSYLIEVPEREIRKGDLSADEVYKISLMEAPSVETDTAPESSEPEKPAESEPAPPVDEGDIREVEIEGSGDQGDGVSKIEEGYIVIVPETEPEDTVTAKMQTIRENFAIPEFIPSGSEDHSL
ncbi:TRAM domain-containing protein [Halobellus sp. EA9]|uniref:TRAM domain-containing protein n=1 Tax=Halobellus sp. EA9 TaxID=3421647 RepID=UPI003EBF00B1